MRLVRIHLQNFRSFRDITIDLDDVTVLIGPNDAGKSTIVDAIRFLLSGDGSAVTDGQSWVHADLASKPSFHPGDPLSYQMPSGSVVVVGDLGDFTPAEREHLSPLIVDGVIRIGAYIDEESFGHPFEYRGPCWVLAVDSPLMYGEGAVVGPMEPPWIHGGEAFVDMHRVTMGGELAWGILAISSKLVPIPTLVWLPGPDRRPPTARSLLQPFVEEVVKRTVDALAPEIVEVLSELTLDIEDTLTTHLSAIIPRYVPGAVSASVTTTGWDPKAVVRAMFTSNADSTEVYVRRDPSDPEGWDPKDRGRPAGSDPESALGAGASRALALGVLELYGDPELWPPDKPVLLALEEPEAGLHPAAQRQVARSLRTLSRKSGLQAIIVTHSPTMIDAVPMAAIRLVRAELDPDLGATSRIYLPTDLAEIAEAVGVRPSDVLLADHFVIVEGPSDVDVFKSWARKLSIEIESSRTVLVSADGWNKAEVVARLARLAYPGSRIDVIVDGGESTNKAEDTIRRRSGREVQVHRLSKPEIEAYLPLAAIERWLVAQGSARGLPGGLGITRPGPRGVSEALNRVSLRDLGRQYRKGSDTGAIASLAKEEEIPAEVSELLIRLLAPEDPEEAAASSPD